MVRLQRRPERDGSDLRKIDRFNLKAAADFRGKKIATPQLGNTQDISCRAWLSEGGLKITQLGGDAQVLPTQNPDQLGLFRGKKVDAVWTVEPWLSRLEQEASGRVIVEEKEVATTILVSSVKFLNEQRDLAKKFAQAHAELTDWIIKNPEEAQRLIKAELLEETKSDMTPQVIASAWKRIVFTSETPRAAVEKFMQNSVRAGFIKTAPDLSKLFETLMSLQEELKGPPPAKLVVDRVSKWFQQKRQTIHALDDVSFEVAEGEFIVIVGPSGCGKSTLLDIIAGLEKPDKGQVLADNQPVLAPGRHRLVMFQESALFPWLNTFGNVMFGLRLKPGLRNPERREVAKFFLHLVGLEKFMEANVHELSGGMKQRVALARALAPNPRVLLMDEPFAALDAMTREQLYGDIQRIWQKRRKTIIFVTHNVREAACLADRVMIMSPTPGRIREVFEVKLPRPRNFNSIEIAQHAAQLTSALKGYMPNATPAEA